MTDPDKAGAAARRAAFARAIARAEFGRNYVDAETAAELKAAAARKPTPKKTKKSDRSKK